MNQIILISSSTIALSLLFIILLPSTTFIIYRILSLAGIFTSSFTIIKFIYNSRWNECLLSFVALGLYLNSFIIIGSSPLSMLDFEHELRFCEGVFYSLVLTLLKQNRYIIAIFFILLSLAPFPFLNFLLRLAYVLYRFKTHPYSQWPNSLLTVKFYSLLLLTLYAVAYLCQMGNSIRIVVMESWGVFCLPTYENREKREERKRMAEEEERVSLKESQN